MGRLELRNILGMLGLLLANLGAPAVHATPDGPDFYKLRDGSGIKPLSLRAAPGATAVVGYLPAGATCIRNRGCQGSDLSASPRWCKVQHQGIIGWVEGALLAEGTCVQVPVLKVSGTVKGADTATYHVPALAGQTLTVTLRAKHPQIYFNVTPAGSQESMFIGSISGNTMRHRIPADGDYRVDVYMMRAAARRAASSAFDLRAEVTELALQAISAGKDALVAGTPFHATAKIPCAPPYQPTVTACDAGVIRRGFDGTATVQIRWPQGVRHVLFIKGLLDASDSAQPLKASRQGDNIILRSGEDALFEIPDALLTGG